MRREQRREARPRLPQTSGCPDVAPERREFAMQIDGAIRALSRSEAAARRALGTIAHVALRRGAHRRLGFVRVGDYARERLGVSGRELQSAASVAARLDGLPEIEAAFAEARLTWTQVRLLCSIATADTESSWLVRAEGCSVSALEARIKEVRVQARAAAREAHAADGGGDAPALLPGADDADHGGDPDDDDPMVRIKVACPRRLRSLLRRAVELARRVWGEPVPVWQAVEAVAAEGLAGSRPRRVWPYPPVLWSSEGVGKPRRLGRGPKSPDALAAEALAQRSVEAAPTEPPVEAPTAMPEPLRRALGAARDLQAGLARLASVQTELDSYDAFALDARLREAMHLLRSVTPRLGELLAVLVDLRLYRHLGLRSSEEYVRERLDVSVRKTRALVRLARRCAKRDAFADAYRDGTLSWVRAWTILPLADGAVAEAWVARARAVTVRRLAAEVDATLDRLDESGGGAGAEPPPLDAHTAGRQMADAQGAGECTAGGGATGGCAGEPGDGAVQLRAPGDATFVDAEISFRAPASVAALFRLAVRSYAHGGEPRWRAVERLLRAAIEEWTRQPRHRDPVFERDGWRCTVPACSSRGPLHDHHLRFRSRGGGNEQTNRTAVCVAHHNHAIHGGTIRAWGSAPDDVHWQLGVRPDGPPLLQLVGDRYVG